MKIIIGLVCLLLLVGCNLPNKEECESGAKVDYNMKNPECNGYWSSNSGTDCECVDIVCKETTCEGKDYISFNMK